MGNPSMSQAGDGVTITNREIFAELMAVKAAVNTLESKVDGLAAKLDGVQSDSKDHEGRLRELERKPDPSDHEKRIRALERKVWMALGGGTTLGAIAGAIVSVIAGG